MFNRKISAPFWINWRHVGFLCSGAERADDLGLTHPPGGLDLTAQKQGAFRSHCQIAKKCGTPFPDEPHYRAVSVSIAACFEFAWRGQGVPEPPWPCPPRISLRRDHCRCLPPPDIRPDLFRDPSPSCLYKLYPNSIFQSVPCSAV